MKNNYTILEKIKFYFLKRKIKKILKRNGFLY